MTMNIDPSMFALLQGQGTSPDTSQLFKQIAERYSDNPMMSMLLTQMMNGNESVDTEDDEILELEAEEVDEDDLRVNPSRRKGYMANEEIRNRIKHRIQSISEELYVLRQHSEELAAALGACDICWGYDDECEQCHGHGTPGWHPPRRDAFDKYVKPAIRALGQKIPERDSVN